MPLPKFLSYNTLSSLPAPRFIMAASAASATTRMRSVYYAYKRSCCFCMHSQVQYGTSILRRINSFPPPVTTTVCRSSSSSTSTSSSSLSARQEALQRLHRVENEGAYVNRAAPSPSRQKHLTSSSSSSLTPRDEAFVTNLVSGVTRWRRYLDFVVLAYYSGSKSRDKGKKNKNQPGDMDPVMLSVLRMGVFELVKLNQPPHVVNEYVELTKKNVNRNAGGLANYLLRAVAVATHDGTLPIPPSGEANSAEQVNALSILYSHPTWLVRRWTKRYGERATVELMEYFNEPPTHHSVRPSLRFAGETQRNSADATARAMASLAETCESLGVQTEPSRVLPGEFVRVTDNLQALVRSGIIGMNHGRRTDDDVVFSVQDEAQALVVAAALDPQPGERILDACAAPGGKTLFALNRLHGSGLLVALDRSSKRLKALTKVTRALGYDAPHFQSRAVDLTEWDGTVSGEKPVGQFDKVLLDAPCSGTGVLHRRADMRWRRVEDDVEGDLAYLQDALLDAAARHVRPGGLLVYSTCSLEPDENEERCASFVERSNGEFHLEPVPSGITNGAPIETLHPVPGVENCVFRSWPPQTGMDGAFAARLRRRSDAA